MRFAFVFLFLSALANAETWSSSSGLSLGPSGVSVSAPPTGKVPELTYDKGSFQLNFSIFGNGAPSSAPTGPVRYISPAASTPSALSDSDTFFNGVGNTGRTEPASRRPSAP